MTLLFGGVSLSGIVVGILVGLGGLYVYNTFIKKP